MPAGEQIVCDGPLSAQSGTQRETRSLSLSRYFASNQALLPDLSAGKAVDQTQQGTPGLSRSSPSTANFYQNQAQTAIPYSSYDSLHLKT